jgi:hypothetical protein
MHGSVKIYQVYALNNMRPDMVKVEIIKGRKKRHREGKRLRRKFLLTFLPSHDL